MGDYHVRWEPVSRSAPTHKKQITSIKPQSNDDENMRTPTVPSRPRKLLGKSKIPTINITPGPPRTMLPLGSPRWSPRLHPSKARSTSALPSSASVSQLLSSAPPVRPFAGVRPVQVDNGGVRQRMFFVGGKASSSR